MKTEYGYRKGERQYDQTRGTSSIMLTEKSASQVSEFMRTSFYLPVDVLKDPAWKVSPIQVMSGKEFKNRYPLGEKESSLYCEQAFSLLESAQLVAVSYRYRRADNIRRIVAKLWYGADPRSPL